MAKKSGKKKAKRPRVPSKREDTKAVARGKLTIRQSRMAKIISEHKAKTVTEAAVLAGYSPKNAGQSGYQALEAIKARTPEVMAECGLNLKSVIQNHLIPQLHATETKIIAHEGAITDYVILEDNTTRRYSTRTALELLGAFPTEQEKQQGSLGVEIIVVDIPRPDRSGVGVKVTASSGTSRPQPHREVEEDPRPKD